MITLFADRVAIGQYTCGMEQAVDHFVNECAQIYVVPTVMSMTNSTSLTVPFKLGRDVLRLFANIGDVHADYPTQYCLIERDIDINQYTRTGEYTGKYFD